MTLQSGMHLGTYEILGPLGAGGMGEVYLARDTRLDREVALKVLPSHLTHDAVSVARFRQEALSLASLNHPNLATVHGLEMAPDGTLVLVLERVEGVTLSQRLGGGPLPVEEALQVCVQLAEALEVAHERGIIHRDVKPGNIMSGPRGLVKVLDFGLAHRVRAFQPSASGASALPVAAGEDTRTIVTRPGAGNHDDAAVARMTPGPIGPDEAETLAEPPAGATATDAVTGMTAGTPGYMSPEQVLAKELDARTDIFAFGCVLYECLTGKRVFTGPTVVQVMQSTLEQSADFTVLPERTPPRVRALLGRCLEKSPAARPADMRAVRIELEEALGIRRASALREGGAAAVPHNLPIPATSFVGRAATLTACGEALENTRLLTLLGMGGSGKTRLALRMAEERLDAFPDGVWFVDVAPLADPGRLVEALAAAMGVRDEPGRTVLEEVTSSLAAKRALLVLDNAETQREACRRLAGHLLAACRELKLLATSREPLGVEAETGFTVPTLDVPSTGVKAAVAAGGVESVMLFVERARAARPAFVLDDDNASAVAEICRRLDGIPLAIELAAARARMLNVEQIRARLDDRFKLLGRSGPGAPSRQETVLAVIQWSFDHLLPPEQDLMCRLAVFTGGWTLERATRVCSDRGDEFEVLDLLTRLVERSLVVVQHAEDGMPRYHFLESVWRFALEKLEGRPEHGPLRERHLEAYLELAEGSERRLTGAQMEDALAELLPEEENLLAAMAWCGRVEDGGARGLRLASSVSRLWSVLGRWVLGRRVMEEALARDREKRPTPPRAKTLARLAGFALTMGDYAMAQPHLEESIAICRAGGDVRGEARALAGLGVVAMYQSRYEDAWRINEESLALYEKLGERRGVAMAVHNLAVIEGALRRGDCGRARFEAALVQLRESGDRSTEALCLSGLATSLTWLGAPGEAAVRLRECFALLAEVKAPREAVYAVEAVADWLVQGGRHGEAGRLYGAAEVARVALAMPRIENEQREVDRRSAEIAAVLGVEGLARQLAAGRALGLEQVTKEAAALVDGTA